jgi:hypothetical protein
MTDDWGVPVNELRCPTCGNRMGNEVDWEYENTNQQLLSGLTPAFAIMSTGRPFLKCVNGHKWTIKTVYRVMDDPSEPDAVLLGDFIGTAL